VRKLKIKEVKKQLTKRGCAIGSKASNEECYRALEQAVAADFDPPTSPLPAAAAEPHAKQSRFVSQRYDPDWAANESIDQVGALDTRRSRARLGSRIDPALNGSIRTRRRMRVVAAPGPNRWVRCATGRSDHHWAMCATGRSGQWPRSALRPSAALAASLAHASGGRASGSRRRRRSRSTRRPGCPRPEVAQYRKARQAVITEVANLAFSDLKAKLLARGIAANGRREVLYARLEEDELKKFDAENPKPKRKEAPPALEPARGRIFKVWLKKPQPDTKLGMVLEAVGQVKIESLKPGGLTAQSGELQVGLVLIAVDGVPVKNHTHAAGMLEGLQMELTVCDTDVAE